MSKKLVKSANCVLINCRAFVLNLIKRGENASNLVPALTHKLTDRRSRRVTELAARLYSTVQ